jgi:hypothetical protein
MLQGSIMLASLTLASYAAPLYLYTAAPRYAPAAWNQGADRFPSGSHLVLVTPSGRRNLAPAFYASADAAVSPDGLHVLFAARPTRHDPWQIWQADLQGGSPTRVYAASDSCIRPLYLPFGKIAYTRVAASGSTIELLSADNAKPDVLTHVPGRFLTSDVLHDGRILFEWRGDLYTVYPDGTGIETLRCDHGTRRSGARQVPSGDVVFDVAGALARFTSALAIQQPLPPFDLETAGPVAEVAAGRWLVAARPHSGGLYAIYETIPGSHTLERIEAPAGMNAVDPVAAVTRERPRDFPSARVPTRTTGNLLCLNARESRMPIDSAVHSVRFYTQDGAGKPQLLGETAIASDGSFYVEVPADRPLRMELLNAAGASVRSEEHWFWMRPSEQRVCVGCHAGPERAPENKVPEILNQILNPVKLLGTTGRPQ